VLATHYEGKRLNSPNDLVYHSSGALYFTDPPYGLAKQDDDPEKELPYNGVYRLAADGDLRLLYRDLIRPNGLAFSPDETVLYVANSDRARKLWMRFTVGADGGLSGGAVLADVTSETAPGVPDGMKVDLEGNLYCTAPGGIRVMDSEGKHLGTLHFPEVPANLHWGDADGRTLYVTARTSVYRIRLGIPGVRPRILN
jgi:gluconolactonase